METQSWVQVTELIACNFQAAAALLLQTLLSEPGRTQPGLSHSLCPYLG